MEGCVPEFAGELIHLQQVAPGLGLVARLTFERLKLKAISISMERGERRCESLGSEDIEVFFAVELEHAQRLASVAAIREGPE